MPNQPAAVLLYDRHGCAPVIAIDLDASRASSAGVEHDFRSLTAILSRAGLTSRFSDRSPNGGRHVYVPIAEPVPFHEASAVLKALARLIPAVDPQPMLSVERGCIRPPGARHKSGGHQMLDGSLSAALAALDAPNDALSWRRLLSHLSHAADGARSPVLVTGQDIEDLAGDEVLPALPGRTEPSADFQAIARTGEYPAGRYASPSEARQAVIWSAVASGWSLPQVARRIEDGTWPGLAALYARYADGQRRGALVRDWNAAHRFEKRRRSGSEIESVRVRITSPRKSQRAAPSTQNRHGGVSGFVREWLAAVDLLHGPETDLAVRAVLYALAEAAVLTGSLEVEHGQRALAIGTGLHQTSVGRALKQLLAASPDRALIDLVMPAKRLRADVYTLRIPALLQPACATKPWRRGRIHAIRPVFRELGLPAAFVYAALEQLDAPTGGRDIAAAARVGVTATYEALQILAAHGLADRVAGGWTLGSASLAQLAEAWGLLEQIRDQIARYRLERAAWRAWLVSRGLLDAALVDLSPRPPPASPPPQAPGPAATHWYDDTSGLLELLHRELGASIVEAS